MAITRSPRPHTNYYVLDKRISEDKRLSWASRGLLVFLLGKPDHWSVSIQSLVNETSGAGRSTGKGALYEILKELIAVGYITRKKHSTGELDYFVHETPITPEFANSENPDLGNADTEKPNVEKTTLVSKDVEVSNKKAAKIEVEIPDWLPISSWNDFVEHRKAINAKLTTKAAQLSIAKLDDLRSQGHDPVAVINQTVQTGKWTGLFGLSDRRLQHASVPHNRRSQPGKQYLTAAEKARAFADELTGRNRHAPDTAEPYTIDI